MNTTPAPSPITTLAALANAVAGRWLSLPPDANTKITGFSIDTRTLKPGDVFIALTTEKADGHDHLAAAANAGASAALVSQPYPDTIALPLLYTNNTLTALHQAAAAHRSAFDIPIIAVIGSNGKTTTRQLIHAAITPSFTGSQSPKSFNNHLGVPLTLLQMRENDDFLLAELGTNHPGELEPLAKLAQPTHLVLTTLGSEHLEHFHNLAGVTAEETSALHHLQPPATLIASTQAWSVVREHAPTIAAHHKPILYSDLDTAAPIHIIPDTLRQSSTGLNFTASVHGQPIDIQLPMLGGHNAFNTLAALTLAHELNIDLNDAAQGLSQLPTVPRRLEPVHLNNLLLIDDAYNANPESTALAIDTFFSLQNPGPRAIVLGDMLELGDHTAPAHRQTLRHLIPHANKIDQLFLIGPAYTQALKDTPELTIPAHAEPDASDEAINRITQLIHDNTSVILIKSSLGLDFLRLRRAIEARFA
ncbi:MAG: UDP-N-acetylmuramoyl-tripeptide--D-alanyl-D-alanine ligase [Phycisphaeraceae bacterium]